MTTAEHEVPVDSQADSRDSSVKLRVAFQGELGAYGDQAITQHWHGAATAVPAASFEHVVTEVAWGLSDYGIIPVWNTVVGDIATGCAAVRTAQSAAYGLIVAGDTHVVVRHQLLAVPGTSLDKITSVASHPVALAQCRSFFKRHPQILPHPFYDTAGAARDIAVRGDLKSAAIAGHAAAERYGLAVLCTDIQDIPDNVTHFLVLTRPNDRNAVAATQPDGVERW
jgi:prephenate dehydratase